MNENGNKMVTLQQLIAAHTKSNARVEALGKRVDDLTAAGGEPNVITGVKVNGTALEVEDKAVDITVPTALSELDNDTNFMTTEKVSGAIKLAIAETGHASFVKVETVPEAAAAQSNVLYLVMNEETGHYDIYAKVFNGQSNGTFADIYGLDIADDETKSVSFNFTKATSSFNIKNTDTMEDVADKVRGGVLTNAYYIIIYNSTMGRFVALDRNTGEETPYTVSVDGETIEPLIAAEMVLLDDTTVDLSEYETAEQTGVKLGNKVDKEDGKGLSANDFTDEAKAKLDGIEFATDEEVAAALAEIYGEDEA